MLCSSRVPCHRMKTKVAARGGGGKKADYIFYFASLSSKANRLYAMLLPALYRWQIERGLFPLFDKGTA